MFLKFSRKGSTKTRRDQRKLFRILQNHLQSFAVRSIFAVNIEDIYTLYYPWINGLHLLDALV